MSDSDFIRELLECSVCLEQLDVTSRVLPCQHTFCKRCLEGIVETHKVLRCPECRIVVATEVCDLPTNILLIRLLDGLKKNPKFVPRSNRQRSHSRPSFRIGREIFFQSSPAPASTPLVRYGTTCPRVRHQNDVRPVVCQTQAASDTNCPKPAACHVLPQRRSDVPTCNRPPRVVPPPELAVAAAPTRSANGVAGNPERLPSTHFHVRALDPTPVHQFSGHSFSRSNSHDYLAGVHHMPGHQLPVSTSTSGRTKSLSRPSSRMSDKHSSLPPRISVSPTRMKTRPESLALTETFSMKIAKTQPVVPITIGNPLYGYMGHHGMDCEAPITGKPAILISENYPDPQASGRRVQALYGCVGETSSELSFEPDAIITDVQSSGEDGWLIGNYMGRRGLLPSNYVQDLPHQAVD